MLPQIQVASRACRGAVDASAAELARPSEVHTRADECERRVRYAELAQNAGAAVNARDVDDVVSQVDCSGTEPRGSGYRERSDVLEARRAGTARGAHLGHVALIPAAQEASHVEEAATGARVEKRAVVPRWGVDAAEERERRRERHRADGPGWIVDADVEAPEGGIDGGGGKVAVARGNRGDAADELEKCQSDFANFGAAVVGQEVSVARIFVDGTSLKVVDGQRETAADQREVSRIHPAYESRSRKGP